MKGEKQKAIYASTARAGSRTDELHVSRSSEDRDLMHWHSGRLIYHGTSSNALDDGAVRGEPKSCPPGGSP